MNHAEKLQNALRDLHRSREWAFRQEFHHEGDGDDRETITETHDEWHDHLKSLGFLVVHVFRSTPETTIRQTLQWVNRGLGTPLDDPRGTSPGGDQHIIIAPPELAAKALTLGLPEPP